MLNRKIRVQPTYSTFLNFYPNNTLYKIKYQKISKKKKNKKKSILHEWGVGWEKASSKKPRDFESVILDKDISTDICSDIENFLSN